MSVNQLIYSKRVSIITTEMPGKAKIPKARFDNPDGTPMTINRDFSGNLRTRDNNLAGPFVHLTGNQVSIKIW